MQPMTIGRCSVQWPWFIAAIDLVIAIVLAIVLDFPANLIAGLVFAATSLVLLPFTSIEVRRIADHLSIEYGPFHWPRQRVALRDIEQVGATDIRPREWGGWGLRGSRKVGKGAAIVLRAGPGIELRLRNDKSMLISVDDADRAAATLRAQLG